MSEQKQVIPQKNAISTEEIKQIVSLFNAKPFNENLTLVALDELNTFQLGDLLSNIFKYLDPERAINAKETQKEQIIFKVSEFLKVLGYQSAFDAPWENGLINGERKVIYPMYYYLLVNLELHKKRAYLAKYLVPLDIPAEYAGDPEIKRLNEQYRELQAQFQVTHENFQALDKASMNPAELKKGIQQFEQEREQLTTKISTMKNKHGSRPEFAALFQATNLLRREQEEEARLVDKIQSQRQQLENAEAQLMSLEQSLADAKKSLAPSNTPQQMLQATKNQVRKNRELVKERMTFEYNERMKKLQNTERMLAEPPITQNELMILESQMMNTRRIVSQMEEKLSKDNPQGDKLAIFKSQAAVVTKKKEQAFQSLKRDEEELESLSNEIRKKEEQVHKLKGTGMAKNQLEGYINEIKEKKVKYTKNKAELEQIRWQVSNLRRTEQILKDEKEKYEKAYGMSEGAVKPDANLANASMEQINKQIEKLMEQIKKKKNALAPKFEEKKSLQPVFEDTERQYKAKKQTFDGTISKIQDEMKDLQTRVAKLKDEVYSMDTKIQLGRFKSEIVETKIARLTEQSDNLHGKGKGVQGLKSYQELFNSKIKEREKEITQLTAQRQKVSDNHLPSLEQLTMFTDLKKLLKAKLDATSAGQSNVRKGEKHGNNVNVLQL